MGIKITLQSYDAITFISKCFVEQRLANCLECYRCLLF